MSIKIIKRGRPDSEDRFHVVCKHCGTEFTAAKKDGKYVGRPALRPSEGDFININCPVCGRGCVGYPCVEEPKLNDLYE